MPIKKDAIYGIARFAFAFMKQPEGLPQCPTKLGPWSVRSGRMALIAPPVERQFRFHELEPDHWCAASCPSYSEFWNSCENQWYQDGA